MFGKTARLLSSKPDNAWPLTPFLFLVFLFSPVGSSAQTVPPPQKTTRLDIGKAVEREVKAREKQSYHIDLNDGQVASFEIKQISTFVRISLQTPDGQTKRIVDIPERKPEIKFDIIADTSGKHQFDVSGSMTVPVGKYEITVRNVRPATADEIDIQKARRLKDQAYKLQYAGKYGEARPLWIRSIEIYERVLGNEAEATGVAVSNLATNYNLAGDYTRSVETYLRAIGILEKAKGVGPADLAAQLQQLGHAYAIKGDLEKAREAFSRALRIYEKSELLETVEAATVIEDLADLYYRIDDYKNAELLYLRASALWEKIVGAEHYHTVLSTSSLGHIAHETGDLAKAENLLRRAFEVTEKNFASTPYKTASSLNDLGSVYITQGDYAKAEQIYLRSLSYLENTDSVYREAAFFGLTRLYWAQGRMPEAVRFARRGIEAEDRVMDINLASGNEREKLALLDQAAGNSFAIVSMQIEFGDREKSSLELAVSNVLNRKGRANDAMADSLSALYERVGPEKKPLIEEYRNIASLLTKVILEGPDEEPTAEHEKKIKELEARREVLETEIGRLTAGYFSRSSTVSLADVRSRIPDNAALIEFFSYRPYDPKLPGSGAAYGEPRYVAYVVRSTGDVGWADLGPAKDIDLSIAALRDAIRDPKRKDVGTLARTTDAKVMAPVRRLLGNASILLVAPDGELNLVPFGALVDESGKYLAEKYSFSYLTSGRDLTRLDIDRDSKENLLIVADPVFGEPPATTGTSNDYRKASSSVKKRRDITLVRSMTDAYFTPIKGTAAEAASIRALFPEARVLSGQDASEGSIKRASAPRMLHIATHGFFLPERNAGRSSLKLRRSTENPMARSGLAFTGANVRSNIGDDGILTALEAANLNLWGTKLVVLSACDTGVGEVRNGGGVYGLRRAFVIAGTESLVMSLWPVSDIVTRELMTGYYKNLKQGMGRGESLRSVQLEMLKRPNRKHPFYWASFIQAGEWANLDGKR